MHPHDQVVWIARAYSHPGAFSAIIVQYRQFSRDLRFPARKHAMRVIGGSLLWSTHAVADLRHYLEPHLLARGAQKHLPCCVRFRAEDNVDLCAREKSFRAGQNAPCSYSHDEAWYHQLVLWGKQHRSTGCSLHSTLVASCFAAQRCAPRARPLERPFFAPQRSVPPQSQPQPQP